MGVCSTTATAAFVVNLLPLLLSELIERGMDSLTASNKQSGDDFGIRLEPGLFELPSRVLSEDVTPQHAPGIGPHEESGGPKNVPVQTEYFSPSGGELPPIQQLLFVIV